MGTKYHFQIFIIISLLHSLKIDTKAQDSLYLVGTITGESTNNRITDVRGIGDVNGDGYGDFIIATRTESKYGIVKLYFGSENLDLTPDIIFHYPGKDEYHDLGTGYGIGDVNGDGYDDFVIAGCFSFYCKGKVFLFYGAETIDTIPVAEFNEPWVQDNFGQPTVGIGDINKDGFDDFIIGSPYNWTNGMGYAYLFWGGDTISFNRCDTLRGYFDGDQFGISAANIGDINNDGFDDLAIGAPNEAFPDSGKIYIYYGGDKMDDKSDTVLNGGSVFNVGDINGDGFSDFITSYPINIYFGSDNSGGLNPTLLNSGAFGSSISLDGDLNNDGFSDILMGAESYINKQGIMVGAACVYLGSNKLDSIPNFIMEGETKWGQFGMQVGYCDINGDRYDDILIFAPNYPNTENPQGRVYIYSYKKFTGIKDHKENLPNSFKLYQNYPNPFNPTTTIRYSIPQQEEITLKIYDPLGRFITTLINERKQAGEYEVQFNLENLPSGIYFYRLKAGGNILINKLMLLK
jgi:hypothetical protein